MEKNLSALGFMSGTSGDGVDTSVISSNGKDTINIKYNRFDPYPTSLSNKIHRVKESISKMQDLLKYSSEIDKLELEITDFHIDIAIKATKEVDYDLIGFHGHTIYHNTEEKISKQIGLGANLSKLTNKDVVYNFRQNDIKNGGEGAPLSPIYHLALIKSLFNENKVKIPISILNIGGIANITEIDEEFNISSRDIGPGNCLIDKWIRKNSDKFYLKKCLSKVEAEFKLYDLNLKEFAENITSEGLEFNTKLKATLTAEIKGLEEVIFLESSRINTTNYISSNMAEEEIKKLRELILDDFCKTLLKNV